MDANLNMYVRDRLGSTVAVVDAKTDQLHIGNRWIGHKDLDLYDDLLYKLQRLVGMKLEGTTIMVPSYSYKFSHNLDNMTDFLRNQK